MKSLGVNFPGLGESDFDVPLGMSSGAADIFGTTGGVMEAALRTACEKLTGRKCPDLDYRQVRGVEGFKEAAVEIGGRTLRVGVSNGLTNAKAMLDKVMANPGYFHMCEVMACPGGCIGGGGQPYPPPGTKILDRELLKKRAEALYTIDSDKRLRTSHDNPFIRKLYEEFLGEPNGHRAHELLHTHYSPKLPRGVR
jgi:iron only hydrogenase large subunit-like protein